MKRVILDENLPQPLRLLSGDHEVVTVQYQGWSGIQNGDLLKLIDGAVTRHDNHVKSGELDFTIKSGNLEREPVGI